MNNLTSLQAYRSMRAWILMVWALLTLLASVACASGSRLDERAVASTPIDPLRPLVLPTLSAIRPAPERFAVTATTGIIAEIVARVGGDQIQLTALMGPGQDPHGFRPTARQMASVAESKTVFVHGWGLEESLLGDLKASAPDTPQVPVAAGIEPLPLADAGSDTNAADPHTWLNPRQVLQWVENIVITLSTLDPTNAALYKANADNYRVELRQLINEYDATLSQIPSERRLLVTNHDSLGYLADAYDFEVVGTVLSGVSTLAEPSAAALASLAAEMEAAGVCTIFAEMTASDQIAQTVAQELNNCADVQVVRLYTGALGAPGSGAETYIGMMRANLEKLQKAFEVN